MELNENTLKSILTEQRVEFQRHVDSRREIQREEFQRYVGIIKEDFDSKFR